MIYISPSLLAADFSKLGAEVERIEDAGANFLHLDVMDGMFVPNISFGASVIGALRKDSALIFDVHLMIKNPLRYIDDFIKAGADIITIHVESCKNVAETLRYIKERDVRVGLALSPKTRPESILPYLNMVDMILVMTVQPGFGGQSFMPEMISKIYAIRQAIEKTGRKIDLEVDGGLNEKNTALVTQAGANVIVAGSAIFKSKKPSAVIKKMRETAKNNPYVG